MESESFRRFIEGHCREATSQVDISALAAETHPSGFTLLVDADSCLDRLYGGFHSDWTSGGEWSRMGEFLNSLAEACAMQHVRLIVVFDGSIDLMRQHEWAECEADRWRGAEQILKPPGERCQPCNLAQYWTPPAGVRNALRQCLRSLRIPTKCTVEDHLRETITLYSEFSADALLTDRTCFFGRKGLRVFSARHFKLTFSKKIESRAYDFERVMGSLRLDPVRFRLTMLLLGGYLFTLRDLRQFHESVAGNPLPSALIVRGVAGFVQRLEVVSGERVVASIFSGSGEFQKKIITDNIDRYVAEALPTIPLELTYQIPNNVSQKVWDAALHSHRNGLCHPSIFPVLAYGEVRLATGLDSLAPLAGLPSSCDLYRHFRRRIYEVLLPSRQSQGEVFVKEWYMSDGNMGNRADYLPIVFEDQPRFPTLESLWFGETPADQTERFRTFERVLLSYSFPRFDQAPLHSLPVCVVLRAMIDHVVDERSMLTRDELHAFLATAVSPVVRDVNVTKAIELPLLPPRAICLASLFTRGLEMVSLANDACGNPFPIESTAPWKFFDGKIFQVKLIKALGGAPLLEVCDGRLEQRSEVQRLSSAILGASFTKFANLEKAVGTPRLPSAPKPGNAIPPMSRKICKSVPDPAAQENYDRHFPPFNSNGPALDSSRSFPFSSPNSVSPRRQHFSREDENLKRPIAEKQQGQRRSKGRGRCPEEGPNLGSKSFDLKVSPKADPCPGKGDKRFQDAQLSMAPSTSTFTFASVDFRYPRGSSDFRVEDA